MTLDACGSIDRHSYHLASKIAEQDQTQCMSRLVLQTQSHGRKKPGKGSVFIFR